MQKKTKPLTLLLIVVSLLCLFATTVSGLEIGNEVIVWRRLAYRGGQQSGEGDIHAPGTRATHYNNRPYWYNGWSIDVLTVSGSGVDLKAQYGGKSYIYCIEYGAHYDSTMTSVVEGAGAQLTNSAFWRSLGQAKQILLQRLMPHCFPALTPAELGVSSVDDAYAASQVVIWEVVQGYRDINGNLTNAALRDQYLKYTYTYGGHTTGTDTPAIVAYNNISRALATHTVKPSWDQSTVSMTWNDTAKRYEASITDTNGVLDQFAVTSSVSGVNVVRSGNTLTLWSGTALSGSVTLRLNKNLKRAADTGALAIFGGASSDEAQKMMYGLLDDPVNSNLAITTDSGTLSLKKTTTVSGGRVSNIEFSVYNAGWNGGIAKSVYTNSSGMLTLSLPVGKYLVSEVTEFAGVEKPAPQMVTVLPGQTTSVSFVNKPKSTTFKVRKVDYSYGRVANIPFRIEQTSIGTGYNFIYRASTDSTGEIHIISTAVKAYYQSFMSRYSNNITCAQAIWKDCYGTSTITDSAKYAQIRETVSHLRNGGSLSVVAGTYSIYELMWGIDSDTLDIEPAHYEGWEEENHEPYREVTIDSTRNLVEFENYAKLSSLLILKTSEDGVVNGIPFLIELLDKDGHVQMTYATSQTVTKRLTIGGVTYEGAIYGNLFDTGTLRITELACAENGYVEQAPRLITLNPNSRATAIFSNVVKPCVATIVKTSESGNVKGFVFHITGTTDWGQAVNLTDLTTDANGKISVELKPGTYTVQEMLTGPQGNVYNPSPAQSLTIMRGQETATVNFHNQYKPATVTIQKTSDSGKVDGFLFAINGTTKSGQEVSITDLVTDANGKIVIELKPGIYTVEEILTEDQTMVYKQPAPQTLTISKGQSTATITVHNAYITVPLSLYKYDFNHNSGAGFAFAITGTTNNGETVRLTDLVTDKNGSIKVDLRPGVYTVTEVLTEEQAKIYEQPAPKTVTIKVGQTSAIVTFSNQAKKLPVSIIKTSDDGQVAGFTFEISGTAANYNAVKLSGLVTDADGVIQVELYPGTYTITEVLTAEQAKIYQQPEPQQLTIPLGQTTVEAVKFHNVVKFGSITIQKTNTAGEVLAGAEYLLEISDDNGTTWRAATESDCSSAELLNGRLVTNSQGIVKFDGLPIGRIRYRITETKAPAGCSLLVSPLFNGTLPFQGNGAVLTHLSLKVSDSLIPTLPATGSNGLWMVPLCAAIALLLMVGSGLAIVRAKRSTV